jgi:hypothetical protein
VGEVIAAIEGLATPVGLLEVGTVGCSDDGGCGDGDEDEAMMSEVFRPVGRVELSTVPEEADTFGTASDGETRTAVVGVGVSPMPEEVASVTRAVVPGMPVVREVGPLRSLYRDPSL